MFAPPVHTMRVGGTLCLLATPDSRAYTRPWPIDDLQRRGKTMPRAKCAFVTEITTFNFEDDAKNVNDVSENAKQ